MKALSQLLDDRADLLGSGAIKRLCDRVVPLEDLEFLYGLVRLERPHLVLDTNTGSGVIAAAIACALEKNGRGTLWSFARPEDARVASELWASLGLARRIQLHTESLSEFLAKYSGTWFDFVIAEDANVPDPLTRRRLLDGLLLVREGEPCSNAATVPIGRRWSVARRARTARQQEAASSTISIEWLERLRPKDLSADFSLLAGAARQFLPPAHVAYFNDPPGREHYRLLAFLSTIVDADTVMDIGTLYGSSALALSYGGKRVVSFDVERVHRFPDHWETTTDFICGDILQPGPAQDLFRELVAQTRLVLLDIDPHDGEKERAFLALLADVGFEGWLLLDDIHLNGAMEAFWASIGRPKVDLTSCGHTTGTGCVHFNRPNA